MNTTEVSTVSYATGTDDVNANSNEINELTREVNSIQVTTSSSNAAILNSRGILRTATTSTGADINRPVSVNYIVSVGGVEMLVSTAINRGFLNTDATGKVIDVPGLEGEVVGSSDDTNSDMLQVSPETIDAIQDLCDGLRGINSSPAAALGLMLLHPDRMPPAIEVLIKKCGLSESSATRAVRGMQASLTAHVGEFLEDHGVTDAKGFYEHASKTSGTHTLNAAISQAVLGGKTDGLKSMIGKYLRSSNQGLGVRGDNYDLVTVHGITMQRSVAKRQGYIQ